MSGENVSLVDGEEWAIAQFRGICRDDHPGVQGDFFAFVSVVQDSLDVDFEAFLRRSALKSATARVRLHGFLIPGDDHWKEKNT